MDLDDPDHDAWIRLRNMQNDVVQMARFQSPEEQERIARELAELDVERRLSEEQDRRRQRRRAANRR